MSFETSAQQVLDRLTDKQTEKNCQKIYLSLESDFINSMPVTSMCNDFMLYPHAATVS